MDVNRPNQINMFNGQSLLSALASLGNNATATELTKYIANLICLPKELIRPEVNRILRAGINNGFLVKNGINYLLAGQNELHQVDAGCNSGSSDGGEYVTDGSGDDDVYVTDGSGDEKADCDGGEDCTCDVEQRVTVQCEHGVMVEQEEIESDDLQSDGVLRKNLKRKRGNDSDNTDDSDDSDDFDNSDDSGDNVCSPPQKKTIKISTSSTCS